MEQKLDFIKPPPLSKQLYKEVINFKSFLETGDIPEDWKEKRKWWQIWKRKT